MPNHCANSLKLTANTPEALELLAKIRAEISTEEPKIFQLIDPTPAELLDTRAGYPKDTREAANIKKYGFAHWYDFQLSRWGTKWNAYEITLLIDKPDTLLIEFDTAWSPPTGIYATLYAKGFDVEATYCEAGCDFIGWWQNGTDNTDTLSVAVPDLCEDDSHKAFNQMLDYFTAHGINHNPPHFGG